MSDLSDRLQKAVEAKGRGDFDVALSLVGRLNKKKKTRSFESISLEVECWKKLGKKDQAIDLLSKVLVDKGERLVYARCCLLLTDLYEEQKQLDKAMKVLNRGARYLSGKLSDELKFRKAQLYVAQFKIRRAVEICRALSSSSEDLRLRAALFLVELSVQLSEIELMDEALEVIFVSLEELSEQNLLAVIEVVGRHRGERLSVPVSEAKRRGLKNDAVNLYLAKALLDEKKMDECSEMLTAVSPKRLQKVLVPLYWNVLGQVQESQKSFAEAFESFTKMNELSRSFLPLGWERDGFDKTRPFKKIGGIKTTSVPPSIETAFIVGFPRSGTTLLELTLDTQPGVAVLDEKPIIHILKSKLLEDGLDIASCLPELSIDYLDELRSRYMSMAMEYTGIEDFSETKLLVDKNPLQIVDLPLIMALFPSTKIILSVRHPLDCILSCYKQTFEVNSQMPVFTSWEACFKHYTAVFDTYFDAKDTLGWADHLVRYESMVSDFDVEISSVFDYLGLHADVESYRTFAERARNRIVNTPSSSQVQQGLYKDARYRWEDYSEHFDSYWEIVDPYIQRWGYSVNGLAR